MIRSTLCLVIFVTLTGCDRQVNIDEPGDLVQSAAVLPTSNPPVVLPETAAPEVSDTSAEQAGAMVANAPAEPEAVVDPVETTGVTAAPSASNRSIQIRVDEPELLTQAAGLVEFTPALIAEDGSRADLSCCDDADGWQAEVPLNSDGQWNGAIQWSTFINGNEIVVLEADVRLDNPGDGVTDISPDSYDRGIDSDSDGIENLTEIVAGTNPINNGDVSQDFLSARVRIPRVPSSAVPIIDGRAGSYEPGTTRFSGEWAAAVHDDVDGNRLSVGNLMFTQEGFATEAENHHWLAMHDGTWLFVLVIIDDAGLHHFDSREVAKPWRDDGIEIFVDGDNSQAQSYDQVDDFSMHLQILNSEASGSNSSTDAVPNVFRAVNSVPLPAGLVYSTGPLRGPSAPSGFATNGTNQDVFEFAIRISDLNIELGRTFGFEVQFNDDDDAGDRDSKWGWAHPAGNVMDNDFTWRDPSFMGRAVLLP